MTIFGLVFTIAYLVVGLRLGLDLVSGKLLYTRICTTLGCNCQGPVIDNEFQIVGAALFQQ